MTSPPDKLFRDGLGDYQKPAPPSAWDRVEANLDKKQPRLPYLFIRIAAGLLLLVAVSISLWPKNEVANNTASVEKETPLPFQKLEQPKSTPAQPAIAIEEPAQQKSESIASAPALKPKKEFIRQPKPEQQIAAVKKEKGIEEPMITKAQPEVIIADVSTPTNHEVVIASSIQEVTDKMTGTSITYTSEEVNARFRKKVTPPDATPEKKSASGFMKVIDTAFEFKNDGSIIGELRDKKNELLSFNGPSDTRDTNK